METSNPSPDYIWTPWGWLRLRSWSHTASTGTPSNWLSVQVQGTRITIQHG
jgi:hypothetical protein